MQKLSQYREKTLIKERRRRRTLLNISKAITSTMNEYEIENLVDAFGTIGSHDPRQYEWGFCITIGRDGDEFCWCNDPKEMVIFAAKFGLAFCDSEDDDQISLAENKINGLLATLVDSQSHESIEGIMSNVSDILADECDIDLVWWGTFSQLCSGKDDFSKELIDEFYEHKHEDLDLEEIPSENPGSIEPKYMDDFITYLNVK